MSFRSFIVIFLLGVSINVTCTTGTIEGYFNGSSVIVLNTTLNIQNGFQFGFRTCNGGQLIIDTGLNNDTFEISLDDASGALIVQWNASGIANSTRIGSNLNSNIWTNVQLSTEIVKSGQQVQIVVDAGSFSDSYVSGPDSELLSIDLSGRSKVTIGNGFIGCIEEGSNLDFDDEFYTENVQWGQCPLETQQGCDDIDHCYSIPCQHNGQCIDITGGYECRCTTRYSGVNCEQDNGNLCGSNDPRYALKCGEGVCQERDHGNYTVCVCPYGYSGIGCNVTANYCASDPCENGASCQNNNDGYYCNCTEGFTGVTCETNIDECLSYPCLNGGVCRDGINNFTCDCTSTGYEGHFCSLPIDECSFSPCENGGTCMDTNGGYICICVSGFTGDDCEEDEDECRSSPCANHGTCVDKLDGFTCECPAGFEGTYCTVNIDECEGITCNDTYVCRDLINAYVCDCPDGTFEEKDKCVDYDECSSSPCRYNSTCINGGNQYACNCTIGYEGTNCDQDINECESNPCLNGAVCEDMLAMYECTCLPGFDGNHCEVDIDECESNPCQNEGVCEDLIAKYNCSCTEGFDGEFCENDIDECLSMPCVNATHCLDSVNNYTCICMPGFVVVCSCATCAQDVDECSSNPCQNNATCLDEINSFSCVCTPEWMGTTCTKPYDACIDITPCQNGGNCSSKSPAPEYNCTCATGFNGTNCENNIDDCQNVDCKNGTICYDLINNYECKCPVGFEGVQCADDIDECASNPCINGVCNNHIGLYNCTCTAGYDGTNCTNDIDECASIPCQNNGICIDGTNMFECFCSHGITGSLCEVDIDECNSDPCYNGATCSESDPGTVNCTCAPGYAGDRCKIDIDECESSPCENGGTCEDNINSFNCTCVPGYIGVNCETEYNECDSSPCENNGVCIDLVNNTLSDQPSFGFECDCDNTGFTGTTCNININECESSPCQHESTCLDLINRYNCSCHPGYEGPDCEVDILECASSPCQNAGTCYERSDETLYGEGKQFNGSFSYDNAAGFSCMCVPGFVDDLCSTNFDECGSSPCQNSATCVDLVNEFQCDCSPGYKGLLCEVEIDECESSPCAVGSTCVDRVAAYQCLCVDGYGGINCNIALTGCVGHSQCLNDAVCVPYYDTTSSTHNFTCTCIDGYIGEFCQTYTAASFEDGSYLVDSSVNGENSLNYTLQFATTLHSGLLLYTESQGDGYLLVELFEGQIFVKYAGDNENPLEINNINSGLNDGNFHTVDLSVNSTIDVTVASTPVSKSVVIPNGYNRLVFGTLYIGGVDTSMEATVAERSQSDTTYIGCMQDIANNDAGLVLPPGVAARRRRRQATSTGQAGCDRVEQCKADTCSGQGRCIDLWWTFSCDCDPTWTGPTCNNSLIPATFSNEQTTSYAVFTQTANITDFTSLELSFKTRKSSGLLFYSELGSAYIAVELVDGKVTVASSFSSPIQSVDMYNDAIYHYLNIFKDTTSLSLLIDSDVHINASAADEPLLFSTHYVGGFTPSLPQGVIGDFFKGCIVDVRYNEIHFEFFPVNIPDFTLNSLSMSASSSQVLEGCVSDDTCISVPCTNNGTCSITFNDYECMCPRNFKGKNCSEETACSISGCPADTTCNDLDDGGIECVAVRTFEIYSSIQYVNNVTNTDLTTMSLQLRIRNQYALLLHSNNGDDYFTFKISDGKAVLDFSISGSSGTIETSRQVNDGYWHDVQVVLSSGQLKIVIDNDDDVVGNVALTSFNAVITDSGSSPLYLGDVNFTNTQFFDNNLGFDGCLEAVRIGGLLLPYLEKYQYDSASLDQFTVYSMKDVIAGCQGDLVCDSNPCQNGATCQDIWNAYTCNCAAGFDGNECANNIDDCLSSPCVNGSCVDEVNMYRCQCSGGFEGVNCAIDINECDSNPCSANSILCVDMVDDFLCTCATNYTGKTCSDLILDLVTCADQPCMNGGTCGNVTSPQPNMPVIECVCAPGYEGDQCSNEIDYCVGNPCVNGQCNSSIVLLIYTCSCFTGYEGVNCDVNIDECASGPCRNSGTCVDLVNGYACTCVPGYTGLKCEQDINECSSNPCVAGICSDSVNSFTCTCDEGYTGSNCSQDIDECISTQPCQNLATCLNTPGNYSCDCPLGFFGQHCDVDPCFNNPCAQGGTCSAMSIDKTRCICPMGYQGDYCGEVTCDSVDCQNGAVCSLDYTTATWSCNCSQFYSGELCDWEGPCVNEPCQNSGTCNHPTGDMPANYTCECMTGYEGTDCETEIDWCETTVCQNGGTCSSSPPGHSCSCIDGWTGDVCQVNIDECDSNPCQNNADCLDYVNGYNCSCSTGWQGTFCDTDIDECVLSPPCKNFGNCTNTDGSYSCSCPFEFIGSNCQFDNPCISSPCKNGGTCDYAEDGVSYKCTCDLKYNGASCENLVSEEVDNTWIIVGASLGGVALFILLIILVIFLLSVKSKRRSQGTYSPSRQEITGSRVEMDNILKLPPEERLI
ncbi:uncharacterized protein [Antedon mediterranea]|uniref:uncharacterized protein n=1 Tax=Antedon mediterranea TaxID=105859 RepID=UPI003AF57C90